MRKNERVESFVLMRQKERLCFLGAFCVTCVFGRRKEKRRRISIHRKKNMKKQRKEERKREK